MDSATKSTRTCQWCSNQIAADAAVCPTCGAATPNPALTTSGPTMVAATTPVPVGDGSGQVDELAEARAIVERLERLEGTAPPLRQPRDISDDLPLLAGVLLGAAVIGGLLGWLLLPPLLADLFQSQLGIETDGAGDFRRMGAFIGALGSLLFSALLGTILRR